MDDRKTPEDPANLVLWVIEGVLDGSSDDRMLHADLAAVRVVRRARTRLTLQGQAQLRRIGPRPRGMKQLSLIALFCMRGRS